MRLSRADRSAYLSRIGLDWSLADSSPSIEGLRLLHRAHLLHVPFENLDIHLGRAIELDATTIVTKIVNARRGGFCYELNTAFAALLSSLGYRVSLIEARVFDDDVPGIAFDHLCLLVELERAYLADVGFGDSFQEPIPFEPDVDHDDRSGRFRIQASEGHWFDLLRDDRAEYRFSPRPRLLADFAPGCQHHQTAQASDFTRRPLATLATTSGRVTLKGLSLVEKIDGERSETSVGAGELAQGLLEVFGIALDEDEVAALADAAGSGAVLFDTAIGRCGVGWIEQRIRIVVLPERSDAVTLARASASVGALSGARPPLFVQRGIDAMAGLVAGERRQLDDLLVDLGPVPEFDRSAYEIARTIPPGEVMTYGAMAKRLGRPGAAQAVGGAMSRNPVPLIVPCHRVVAADGRLGGFSANGGTVTKRRLLEIEGAPIDRSLF